jgi:hypothetical protein
VERRCNLWVHEESFSKNDVVLNLDLFPDVKPGDLMAIVSLKADLGVRDFQEKAHTPKKDADNLPATMRSERSNSNPKSPSQASGTDIRSEVELGRRCLFIVKPMSSEMKAKQPGLEVSVAKHIADIFHFKHRSNVLVTSVRHLCALFHYINSTNKCSRLILLVALLLMWKCPLRMNILHGLICGGWRSMNSATKPYSRAKKYCSWARSRRR